MINLYKSLFIGYMWTDYNVHDVKNETFPVILGCLYKSVDDLVKLLTLFDWIFYLFIFSVKDLCDSPKDVT